MHKISQKKKKKKIIKTKENNETKLIKLIKKMNKFKAGHYFMPVLKKYFKKKLCIFVLKHIYMYVCIHVTVWLVGDEEILRNSLIFFGKCFLPS